MTSGASRPPVARPAPSSRPRDARPRVPRSLSSRVPFPRRTTTPARPLPPATLPLPLTHPSRAPPPSRNEKPSLHRDAALFGPGGRERWEREAEARVRARGGVAPPRWASSSPSSPGGVIPPSPPTPRFALVRSPHPPAPGDVIPWYEDPGPSSAALPIARAEAMLRRLAAPTTRAVREGVLARDPAAIDRRLAPGAAVPRARATRRETVLDVIQKRRATERRETKRDEPAAKAGEGPEKDPGAANESARRLGSAASSSASSRSSASAAASLASAPRVRAPRAPGRRATTAEANRAWARPPRSEASAPVSPRDGLMERNGVEFAAMARLERATRPARVDPDLLEGARRSFSDDVANNTSAARAAAAARVLLAPARARAQRRRGDAARARIAAIERVDEDERRRRLEAEREAERERLGGGGGGAGGAKGRRRGPPASGSDPSARSIADPSARSIADPSAGSIADPSAGSIASEGGGGVGASVGGGGGSRDRTGPAFARDDPHHVATRRFVPPDRAFVSRDDARLLDLAHNPGAADPGGAAFSLASVDRLARRGTPAATARIRRWCDLVGVPRRESADAHATHLAGVLKRRYRAALAALEPFAPGLVAAAEAAARAEAEAATRIDARAGRGGLPGLDAAGGRRGWAAEICAEDEKTRAALEKARRRAEERRRREREAKGRTRTKPGANPRVASDGC